jgi:hypothetical protein
MGVYKGRTRDHLERVIQVRMEESQTAGALEVRDKTAQAAVVHSHDSRAASSPNAPATPAQDAEPVPSQSAH